MIRRLMEAHFFQNNNRPSSTQIGFWLRELRTPELLVEIAQKHMRIARRIVRSRSLLALAMLGKTVELEKALITEETEERKQDRCYWLPLRKELEKLRHAK